MIDAGVPEIAAEDNARASSLFAQGDAGHVTDDVPAIPGRPALAFGQFANGHAAAFS